MEGNKGAFALSKALIVHTVNRWSNKSSMREIHTTVIRFVRFMCVNRPKESADYSSVTRNILLLVNDCVNDCESCSLGASRFILGNIIKISANLVRGRRECRGVICRKFIEELESFCT